jgi:hypothetical protein
MNNRDFMEMHRAEQARQWLAHPDRIIENKIDEVKRDKATIASGHSLKCTLSKCHPDCSKQ